jgi:hypothetical protein
MHGNKLSVNATKKEAQRSAKFARGGSPHGMFKQQAAGTDRPGNTGKDQSAAPGPSGATGGSIPMFGFTPSQPAEAGITSAPPRIKPVSTRNYGKRA